MSRNTNRRNQSQAVDVASQSVTGFETFMILLYVTSMEYTLVYMLTPEIDSVPVWHCSANITVQRHDFSPNCCVLLDYTDEPQAQSEFRDKITAMR